MWLFEKDQVEVKFHDGKTDVINATLLNIYIETGRIVQFRRSDGWVTIGKDPIRGQDGEYLGRDRRKQ